MNKSLPNVYLLACSIFREEIEMLRKEGLLPYPVQYIDSTFHIVPIKLETELNRHIDEKQKKGTRVVLAYGECHARMDQTESPVVKRTPGMNCIEIILGKDRYHQLRKEGAFFLMPEWTSRWKEVFEQELGLTEENARMIMEELHHKLIYLDTGVWKVPWDTLDEIKSFTGLPVEVEKVELDLILHAIQQKVKEVSRH